MAACRTKLRPRLLLVLHHLLAAILTVRLGDCAFIHAESAIVRRGVGLRAGSLFGYRVAVVKDMGGDRASYMLVSDPTAVDSVTGFSSGIVYRCPISAGDFNTTGLICRDSELRLNYTGADPEVYWNVTQFGASMSTLPSGQFIVCAPGYNFVTLHNQTATPGLCAYWQSLRSGPRWLGKFFPSGTTDRTDRMFSNCMGAFQAELLPYGKEAPRLAVSGPFCMLRRLALVWLAGGANQPVQFEHALAHDYMGFSLATDRASGSVYATSPHTNVENGAITFMTRIQQATVNEKRAKRIVAPFGTQFYNLAYRSFNFIGYSSATIMVLDNGIKKTAVVLGAPFESGASSLNQGCVFVFVMPEKDDDKQVSFGSTPAHYCGTDAGGRLGTSVVGIGDVNHDGSDDFAVGCPGCGANGTGAVYLFLGPNGNLLTQLEPFDILYAANVSSELSGLGWSLALADDVDGNGAGELVASAVSSGHVVVLPEKVLLRTSIDLSYTDGGLLSNITMSQFSDVMGKVVALTITMEAGPEFSLTGYHCNLQIRLQEYAEEEQYKRFEIEVVDEHLPLTDNWWQVNRTNEKKNQAKFVLKFKLKALSNIHRHLPVSKLLEDVTLLVQWRLLNRTVPVGSNLPFPAVLYKNKVLPNYETEIKRKLFGFNDSVCHTTWQCLEVGNIKLLLVNASNVMLNSFQPITVALSVEKTTPESYYGGAAIQMNMTQGVFVMGVEVKQNVHNFSKVNYWSEHNEVLVTEPYPPRETNFLTEDKRGKLTVYVQLKFDGRHSNYHVNFNLVNIMAKEGYQAYVTKDSKPWDNNASLEIAFNTSLTLKLLSRTDESAVVDTREKPDEAALLSLKGRAAGDAIGPGLQHTYELYAVTKPRLPVDNLSLTVRLPFVTADNKLLLYFPRGAMGSGPNQLPGLPFLSDSIDAVAGNRESACRPVESDLAELLFRPDLILMDEQHRVNVSERARRDVSSPDRLGVRGTIEGLAASPMDNSLNASVSMATSDIGTVPSVRSVDSVPVFDCEQPHLAPSKLQFRCITFRCIVHTMNQSASAGTADRVFLHVHAKVWSPTYFAAYLKSFSIKSDVSLSWQSSPAFMNVDIASNSSAQQKFLFLSLKPPIATELPWGYIVLAIFLGIWLLMLCMLLMWYCNFFKRQRLDYSAVQQGEAAAHEDDFYH